MEKKPLIPRLANVIQIADKLVQNGLLKINGNTAKLHQEVGFRKSNPESFFKNIYLYMVAKRYIKDKDEVFFVSIESNELRATYSLSDGFKRFD